MLRDGRKVRLRLLRPEDRGLLREGFERLSPESRYRRFFTHKSDLSNAELEYLTDIDNEHHLAIGAIDLDSPEPRGLGVARCVELPGRPGVAEAAVAVADEAQGNGLGSLLFQRLIAAATERGIETFHNEVLGSNAPMQAFLRRVSPGSTASYQDGVATIEFTLPNVTPTAKAADAPRDSAVYEFFRLAAEGAVHLKDRFLMLLGGDEAAPTRQDVVVDTELDEDDGPGGH